MTSPGPIADALARLRVQHPDWRVYKVDGPDWCGWAAYNGEPGDPGEQLVTAPTLLALEVELAGR